MTESLNNESLPPINGWREAVKLPVTTTEKSWNIDELKNILIKSIKSTAEQSLKDNNGEIYMTLSGGLDSSLCLAIIRNIYPDVPIHTFTVATTKDHPDITFARAASFIFQTLHQQLIVNDDKKSQIIEEFQRYYGDEVKTEGNINPWTAYQLVKESGAKSVIAHDGIDEQMGGYWPHRKFGPGGTEEDKQKQEEEFEYFWSRLEPDHLITLEKTADYFDIKILFPYLQKDLVEYISHIPVSERATGQWGKVIMRKLAKKYVWKPIRERAKFGFGQAFENKEFFEKTIKAQEKAY